MYFVNQINVFRAFVLMAAITLCGTPSAQADDPSMTNLLWGSSGYEVGQVDGTRTDIVSQVGFTLFNISTNKIATNNLVAFTFPAGTIQGVYRVEFYPHSQHWTAAISDSVTIITNPGFDLPPGKSIYLYFYSTSTNATAGTGAATALSAAAVLFNALSVPVPTDLPPPSLPAPSVAGLAVASPASLLLTNLVVGKTTTVMRAASLGGSWSVVTSFVATSTSTNLPLNGASDVPPASFYQVLQSAP